MRLPNNGVRLRVALVLLVFGLIPALRWLPGRPAEPVAATRTAQLRSSLSSGYGNGNDNDNDPQWPDRGLIKQSDRVANLGAYAHDASARVIPARLLRRPDLLVERSRLRVLGDRDGIARLNAVLSSEAFARAAKVTTRWLDRRDPASGLFSHTLSPRGHYWSYGDVGADLFPFLGIATRRLMPERYPEILSTLAAERSLTAGFPHDVMISTLQPRERKPEEQMLANVEYAKDGLLPLIEELGPEPWLPRMREVLDSVIAESSVPTPAGPLPSDAAEVNGSLLQALARLSWTQDDPR